MATPTDQSISPTYNAESREAYLGRLNNVPRDKKSRSRTIKHMDFNGKSNVLEDDITKHEFRPDSYSSACTLNTGTSNTVEENHDDHRKMTDEQEENDENEKYDKKLNEIETKIAKKTQNQLEDANKTKEEYVKKLNEMHSKNNQLQNQVEQLRKKNHIFIGIAIIVVAVLIGLSLGLKEHEENQHELRLMLVGKTGAGKSATGNTILGENAFRVEASPASVTGNCEKKNKFIAGRNITIIDTPGVMDTWLTSEQMAQTAPECTSIFRPAPHVFLLVIRLGRFTEEEMNAVKWIQENFGEQALKFTLILFTGGDLLEGKPVEKFISNSNELQSLVDTCQGRFHVFNNYEQSKRTQVTQLFKKINQMLHENTGYICSAEFKKDEKRKMNEMAKKLRDEQFENTKLKAELNKTQNYFLWFIFWLVICGLTLTLAWLRVK